MSGLKIFWVGDSPTVSTGFGVVSKNILKQLYNKGYDITVLGINHFGEPLDHNEYPYPIHPCEPGSTENIFGMNRLWRLLPQVQPDILFLFNDPWIIHSYLNHRPNNISSPYLKTIGYYPIDAGPIKYSTVLALKELDAQICYSHFAERIITEANKGVRPDNLYQIYHGVDTKTFYPINQQLAREKLGIPVDSWVVGMVARNQYRKRFDILISAFAKFAKNKKDVKLYLHTVPNDVGFDILDLIKNQFNIEDKILLTEGMDSPAKGVSEEMLNLIYNSFDANALISLGDGFCVDPETPVMLEGGTKAIKDIILGDKVLTREGFKSVINTFSRIAPERFSIRTSGQPNIIVTPEHPLLAVKRPYKSPLTIRKYADILEPNWINAENLEVGDLLAIPRIKLNRPLPKVLDIKDFISPLNVLSTEDHIWSPRGFSPRTNNKWTIGSIQRAFSVSKRVAEDALHIALGDQIKSRSNINSVSGNLALKILPEIESPKYLKVNRNIEVNDKFLWLLGWYLAEGSSNNGKGIEFSLNNNSEYEIGLEIAQAIKSIFGLEAVVTRFPARTVCKIWASSTIVAKFFEVLVGKGARNKHLHKILQGSGDYLGPLLNSYAQGDGSLIRGGLSITTASSSLAWQIYLIMHSVGIPTSIRSERRDGYSNGEMYVLNLNGLAAERFQEWSGFKYRKQGTRKSGSSKYVSSNYIYTPIRSINYLGSGEVRDITVEEAHEFIGGGLLSHNCLPVAESMAVGCPQIVSDHSCLKELVGDSQGGLTVKTAAWLLHTAGITTWGGLTSEEDLIEKLEWSYSHKEIMRKYGEQGYNYITQPQFNWTVIGDSFDRIIKDTLHIL